MGDKRMPFPISDALSLIRSAANLLKEESTILASSEDAAYFRTLYTNNPKNLGGSQNRSDLKDREERPPLSPANNRPKSLSNLPVKSLEDKEKSEKEKVSSSPAAPPAIPANCNMSDKTEPTTQPAPQVSQPVQPQKAPARPPSQLRSIIEKIAPDLAILDRLPDDTSAKQIANRWKTKNQSAPISILSNGELPQHQILLAEIATALDVYFGPAKLIVADSIEKEKQWKTFLSVGELKLIIVCDSTLWQLHNLRQFYIETPTTGVRMLGTVPLFLLPDLSLYLKDPLLKRSLWKALCAKLS